MAISSNLKDSSPPPLPPRPNTDTSEPDPIELSTRGKTPPAWLYALLRYSPEENNHSHEFYLSKEFDSDGDFETVFLCQKCHNWFYLTTTNPSQGGCNNEYNLHHFHTTTMSDIAVSAICCLCDFCVNIEIKKPLIDTRIFDELSRLRKQNTYANAVRHDRDEYEYKVNLDDVINNMATVVNNVLSNDLNIDCENFKKVGVDSVDRASQAFFEKLGFHLIDDYLLPPDHNFPGYAMENARRAKEELRMMSKPYLGFDEKRPYEKLNKILGTSYKLHFAGSCRDFDPESGVHPSQPSCFFLGCVPDMDDKILIWAYLLGIREDPQSTPEYLQAIYEISKERQSETLQEKVLLELSEGKFHKDYIKEAYECLNCRDVNVSDRQLIESYNKLSNEDPSSRARYRQSLDLIGRARNSTEISRFVNEGAYEIPSYFSEMPVGLDNIGNTCYLNSLLQYYFTIRPLRKAVLATDLSSANGYEFDWQSITIGHRKISRSEVERAKKFVTLLRGLFVNLIHTAHRSISPDVDLAYLALVSARNDEDEYKETSKSPCDKMNIDSSPGPSPGDCSDNNYTISEEETVEMEGTAPSANDDSIIPKDFYSIKGKEKESDYFNTTKEDKLKAASEMLFGRQQDVTECMDNVMFQLEAALKSLSVTDENGYEQNVIKSLFYGQTRQILHKQKHTGEPLTKEESFNHLIVVVDEGRDLYDGLDVYFDASLVDYDGTKATREVTITQIPPILQIHVQRVQFDRSTSNVYKSNAFLRFENVIYLDRYLEKNYELLKQRRREANDWKQEIDRLQTELEDYERDKGTMLSTADLLKSTADFIHDMKNIIIDESFELQSIIEQESNNINAEANECRNRMSQLKSKIRKQYEDLKECEYCLHAVFIHSGQANFGHYWIYIFDFERNQWLKFNDSYVTEVDDREVFADTTGSSANPYCMVYVRAKDAKELVETVCRQNN